LTNTLPEDRPATAERMLTNTLPEDSPATAEMSFEKQQAVLKEILSRKPKCKFDETQAGFKTFLCPVCLDVFKNPVDHSCGNTFCSDCVKSVSSCPICRKESKPEDYKPASLIVRNSVLSLRVVCDVCGKGMTHEEFNASHDKNCSFSCPFGCGEQVNRSTFEIHCKDGKCMNYLLSCPASEPPLCCKWHGHGGPEYDDHVSKCVLIPLIPFVAYTQNAIATLQSSMDRIMRCACIVDHNHELVWGHKYVCGKCQRCGAHCSHENAAAGLDGKCKHCGDCIHENSTGGVYGKCKHCGICNHERNGGAKGKCKHCGDCIHENASGGVYGKCKYCGVCNHENASGGVYGECKHCRVCNHERNGGANGKCKHCGDCIHERNGGAKGKCKHCGDCIHERNGGAKGECKHCGDCIHVRSRSDGYGPCRFCSNCHHIYKFWERQREYDWWRCEFCGDYHGIPHHGKPRIEPDTIYQKI